MYVTRSPVSSCLLCPVPCTPYPVSCILYQYKYDSAATLSRQVESPVRLTTAISAILPTPSQKAAAESLVITTLSLLVIVA
jgi:hypothetical protein